MSEHSWDETTDWKPPNEAELKVLEARHERNNLISKLMGAYMLKGYRMLDRLCPVCNTILLQDRNIQDYCVACQEIESETSKDDPATSAEAAAAAIKEQNERKNPAPVNNFVVKIEPEITTADAENTELTTDPLLEETHETEASHAPLCTETALKDYNPDTEQLFNAYLQIKSRVSRFANKLADTDSAEDAIKLCNAIKACSEAGIAIKKLL